jgi:hypothetical protein
MSRRTGLTKGSMTTALAVAAGLILLTSSPTTAGNLNLPTGKALRQFERVLQACKAKGLTVEQCQRRMRGMTASRADDIRVLMARCRLKGILNVRCQKLIERKLAKRKRDRRAEIRAHCIQSRLPRKRCQALLNEPQGKPAASSNRLIARCRAAGMSAEQCFERIEVARRRLLVR